MKNPLIYIIFIAVLFSCGEDSARYDDSDDDELSNELFDKDEFSEDSIENTFMNFATPDHLTDTVNFKCQEWYPGKKQVKIEGGLDRLKRRHGTWYYYNESGDEMSMTTYTNGRKQGFSIVKHSNGALYYTGEYNQDQKVGIWKFYNEKGQKVNEINYTNE